MTEIAYFELLKPILIKIKPSKNLKFFLNIAANEENLKEMICSYSTFVQKTVFFIKKSLKTRH